MQDRGRRRGGVQAERRVVGADQGGRGLITFRKKSRGWIEKRQGCRWLGARVRRSGLGFGPGRLGEFFIFILPNCFHFILKF